MATDLKFTKKEFSSVAGGFLWTLQNLSEQISCKITSVVSLRQYASGQI